MKNIYGDFKKVKNEKAKKEIASVARYYLKEAEGMSVVSDTLKVNDCLTLHIKGNHCEFDIAIDELDAEVGNVIEY